MSPAKLNSNKLIGANIKGEIRAITSVPNAVYKHRETVA